MENSHRDALGLLTAPLPISGTAECGHALRLDALHDEACPYCLDYLEAMELDRLARERDSGTLAA